MSYNPSRSRGRGGGGGRGGGHRGRGAGGRGRGGGGGADRVDRGGHRASSSAPSTARQQTPASEVALDPSISEALSQLSLTERKERSERKEERTKVQTPLVTTEVSKIKPPGTIGRVSKVVTNYFPVQFKPQDCHRVNVEFIEPQLGFDESFARRRVLNTFRAELTQCVGQFFFDGTNVLSFQKPTFEKKHHLKNENNEIELTYTAAVKTNNVASQEVNMLLNILLKQFLRRLQLIQLNRSYYYKQPDPVTDQHGNELSVMLFRGFTTVIGATQGGLRMCVDLAHRVMQKTTVRDQIRYLQDQVTRVNRGASPAELSTLISRHVNNELKGACVVALYNSRIWRIDMIDFSMSVSSTFKLKDGKTTTFREYYESQYKLKVPNVEAGLIACFPNARAKEPLYIIPEFCHMTGMTDAIRSNFKLNRALAGRTRSDANTRYNETTQLMADILSNSEIGAFPITLDGKPVEVQARILGSFELQIPKKTVTIDPPTKNSFGPDVRSADVFSSPSADVRLSSWAFIYPTDWEGQATKFANALVRLSKFEGAAGNAFPKPQLFEAPYKKIDSPAERIDQWRKVTQSALAAKPAFIVHYIPNADQSLYSFIKCELCTVNGVISQCVSTDSQAKTGIIPVAGNTVKQILAKLGNILWKVDFRKHVKNAAFVTGTTMMIGLDVCHESKTWLAFNPTGKPNGAPTSTVGWVASYDKDFSAFHSFAAFQGRREECVVTARELMKKSLELFAKKNEGNFPASILMYRDGVGDSQLESFVRVEIKDYESAFAELNITPKLTVIVVQKRVKDRFFAPCPRLSGGKCPLGTKCGDKQYHSPLPGTVVDTNIVSPIYSEFFLVPSIAPPGATARPTRFKIFRDDMQFTMDDLEVLTNQACYMYANWNGPIRVPHVAMYGHKIAYLFGRYVNGLPHANLANKLFYL